MGRLGADDHEDVAGLGPGIRTGGGHRLGAALDGDNRPPGPRAEAGLTECLADDGGVPCDLNPPDGRVTERVLQALVDRFGVATVEYPRDPSRLSLGGPGRRLAVGLGVRPPADLPIALVTDQDRQLSPFREAHCEPLAGAGS